MNASVLKHEIETLLGLTGTQAVNFWRAAGASLSPSAPAPVPIPYPNFTAGAPVSVQGTDSRFNGKYFVSGTTHKYGEKSMIDLFECVRIAVLGNDETARRIWPVWVQVKRELGRHSTQDRNALGHELTHTLQQRRGRS